MAIKVRLQESKFKEENRANRWFLRTVSQGEVSTETLAKNIERNTSFTRGDVRGLIFALVDEMQLQLGQGKTVVLEDIGRFYLSVESHAKASPKDFNLKECVKNVKCKFVPSGNQKNKQRRKIDHFGNGVEVEWYDGE